MTLLPKSLRTLLCFSTLFFSLAHADPVFNRYVGQYVALNMGASYVNDVYYNGNTIKGFRDWGGNLLLGDQINPYFAPEVSIAYLSLSRMGRANILSGGGRFTVPIGSSFLIFGKLGVGYSEIRTCFGPSCISTNDVVPTFGGGFGVSITTHWMTSAEFNGEYLPNSTANARGVIGAFTVGLTHYWTPW